MTARPLPQTSAVARIHTENGQLKPSWRPALFFSCIAATAVVLPMCFLGNISGHDFQFHVESWMDVAGQWHEGILFPRWAEGANWGFGEPRFIFYPPLSWILGAALGSLLPWKVVPGVYIWLMLVLAGMSMWRFARDWLASRYAVLAAVLYAVNPYHLVIVYYRSAFGELLAVALLPLLIWSTIRVIQGEKRRIPILAVVFAALWLSNAPAAVIATYSLAIAVTTGCALRRSIRPLIFGAAAMAGGISVAAFYILPAAFEEKWVQITQVISDNLRPTSNFLFAHASDPDYLAFNRKISFVAVGLICAAAIATLANLKKRAELTDSWPILSVLGSISTLLMLPVSAFLWRVAPRLAFVQFPWRWLELVGLAFAFFSAAAVARVQHRHAQWAISGLLFVAILASASLMIRNATWASSDVSDIAASIRDGRGYEGADEYAPVGCDRYRLPGNPDDSERPADVSPDPSPRIAQLDSDSGDIVPIRSTVHVILQTWTSTEREFAETSDQPVTLALRLVDYPAWTERVNGRLAQFDLREETAQMLLPLPAGDNHVELQFRRTADRTIADLLSAASAIGLGLFGWVLYRKRA